jgi:anthranilate synthase component 2
LYHDCPSRFLVGRYHSWAVKKESVYDQIVVTAVDDDQEILSLKHSSFDVNGIQYHPESILSEYGKVIINNFLSN